jgi:hypothetical protein
MKKGWTVVSFLAACASSPAFASPDLAETSSIADTPGDAPRMRDEPPKPPLSPYRNPEGSIALNAFIGVAVSSSGSRYGLGVGVGYAFITGVVPGVRALVVAGDGVGGELAATLTLTPPIATSITPFAVGEAGRRFDPIGSGWLYGAGGGIYIGEPQATFGFQIGWIFRRIVYPDPIGSLDDSGPIVAISARF